MIKQIGRFLLVFLLMAMILMVGTSSVTATINIADLSEQLLTVTADIKAYCYDMMCRIGTGFVIDSAGLVVTNYYLINNVESITVEINNVLYDEVEVVMANKGSNLALLKIAAENLPTLPLANTAKDMQLYDEIILAVNEAGELIRVFSGFINKITYSENYNTVEHQLPIFKVNIPFSFGHEGGPVINLQGEVIGINLISYWDYKEPNAVLPIDLVHKLLAQYENANYHHQLGQLAVMLEWQDDVDIDLVIYDQEYFYVGEAYQFGVGPDITSGSQGVEWLIFQEYNTKDLSTGSYVIIPYFVGPYLEQGVMVRLTVFFSDGTSEYIEQEMSYSYPYDQWFALALTVDNEEVTILDYFSEDYDDYYLDLPKYYTHQKGDLAVVLQWDNDIDLDLEIWTAGYEYLYTGYFYGYSPDVFSGLEGEEWLVLQEYWDYDFSLGSYIFSAFNYGPAITEKTTAQMIIYFPDGEYQVIEQKIKGSEHLYQNWFAVLLDVDNLEVIPLDFFADEAEIPRLAAPPAAAFYEHQAGDLAVVLSWTGDSDLDLEIWTENFNYLDRASWVGDSPNVFYGGGGEEWFVFKEQTTGDYTTGKYVIAVYNHGSIWDEEIIATITVYLSDGEIIELTQSLTGGYPYYQWFPLLIDAETNEVEILDFFADEVGIPDYAIVADYYSHKPGDFAVVLSWDQAVDLDLEIWDGDLSFLGRAAWYGDSYDVFDGRTGEEWFVFKNHYDHDYSTGQYIVSIYQHDSALTTTCEAKLTVFLPTGEEFILQQQLQNIFPYSQWFAVLIDTDKQSVHVLDKFGDQILPFNFDFRGVESFEHQQGEVTAYLFWQADVDLDLEIWNINLDYLGTGYSLGESFNVYKGGESEEWFAFRNYQDQDFSRGQYFSSTFNYGPELDQKVEGTMGLILSEGNYITTTKELSSRYPDSLWFGFALNLDKNIFAYVNHYADEIGLPDPEFRGENYYTHQQNQFAAVLQWQGDIDLDIEVYSADYQYLVSGYGLGESQDIISGYEGQEWVIFQAYEDYDLSSGRYIIGVYSYGPPQDEPVDAEIIVYFPEGGRVNLTSPQGFSKSQQVWFALEVNVDEQEVSILNFFER